MRSEQLAEGITLYCGDCREIVPTLAGIDAVITSPPYGQQRDYGQKIADWRLLVSSAICSIQYLPHTQVLVNLGLIYRDGECVEYWGDLISDMRSHGFRLFGWYVWDKGFGAPGDWNGRCAPAHEFIFHFNRASRPAQKWVKTQERDASGTGLRLPNGSMSGITSPDACGQPTKVPDSVFRFPPHQARGGPENEHPAIFPVLLPTHLIKTFSAPNEIVLDPFMGSGTTGVAAVQEGRSFVGIELEPKWFDLACRRIAEGLRQPDLFISQPTPKPEQQKLAI